LGLFVLWNRRVRPGLDIAFVAFRNEELVLVDLGKEYTWIDTA